MTEDTLDKFLDGRVVARQPERGFRSGLDAVMLAAAVPARRGQRVLEMGAGAGIASLCLLARVQGCHITGIEIDPSLVALANRNADENGRATHARFVEADVCNLPQSLRGGFDHVLCNPPFYGEEGMRSPDMARARATHDAGTLGVWIKVGMKRTAAKGTFTAILPPDRLGEALAALPSRGIKLFPLWPRAGEPAKRLIVQAVQGSRTPLALLPGLVLHRSGNRFRPEASAILRDGAALTLSTKGKSP